MKKWGDYFGYIAIIWLLLLGANAGLRWFGASDRDVLVIAAAFFAAIWASELNKDDEKAK